MVVRKLAPTRGIEPTSRFSPNAPLKREVPFGKETRTSVQQQKDFDKLLDVEMKRKVDFKTKKIGSPFFKARPSKPTQKERARIIKAKLQKMAGIDDIAKKITDIAMKQREKNVPAFLASPKGGSPQLQRRDPTTPLIKKVPFGPSAGRINPPDISIPKEQKRKLVTLSKRPERLKRMHKKIERRERESRGIAKDIVSMEGKPKKNPLLIKTNKGLKVRPPKPTKTEFREIISARLQKLGVLRPLILKKKNPKRIFKRKVKSSGMQKQADIFGPLTGRDILKRFKNMGLSGVQKETGFTFLPDENRLTNAFVANDAQFLRTKFKTPTTSSLSFVSRTKDIKFADDLEGPLEGIRTEGKTALIGGFNDPKSGFEFDATFPMESQNDNEVIEELMKTNQKEALAIDPDLSVRTIPNPNFRITSKTSLQ